LVWFQQGVGCCAVVFFSIFLTAWLGLGLAWLLLSWLLQALLLLALLGQLLLCLLV